MKPPLEQRDWLTVPEAAEALGINHRTAGRLIKAGKFPVPVVELGPRSRRVPKALIAQLLGKPTVVAS